MNFTQETILIDFPADSLIKKNTDLSELETTIEKLDSFLVLKNSFYDDVIFKIFELHYIILKFRILIVKKLNTSSDRNVLLRHYFFERKCFLFEALAEWPKLRIRQRNHYAFYLGDNFVETAKLDNDVSERWSFLHFSNKHYCETEPEFVQDHSSNVDFFLSSERKKLIYRELNEFLIHLSECLEAVSQDSFYNGPCFDELMLRIHDIKIEVFKLRQICVKNYICKTDARHLNDFYQHRIEILEDTDLKNVRQELR